MEKPEKFEGKIIEKDGKKVLKIKPRIEVIKYKDGRQDVIVHVPSLSVIAETLKLGGK